MKGYRNTPGSSFLVFVSFTPDLGCIRLKGSCQSRGQSIVARVPHAEEAWAHLPIDDSVILCLMLINEKSCELLLSMGRGPMHGPEYNGNGANILLAAVHMIHGGYCYSPART